MHRRAFSRLGLPMLKGDVLDIGSGRAPYSSGIREATVVTMDFSPAKGPMSVGSTTALPFKDSSFDGIVCTEVLEHVSEPEAALVEIFRVLRPGGKFYITVPMYGSLHYEPHDFYRFTKYGIAHLMEKVGLQVRVLEPLGGLFSFIGVRFSESFYNVVNKIFCFLPRGPRLFLIVPIIWPINFIMSAVASILDSLGTRDVMTWVVTGVKEDQ